MPPPFSVCRRQDFRGFVSASARSRPVFRLENGMRELAATRVELDLAGRPKIRVFDADFDLLLLTGRVLRIRCL
jgi:hypothetical protein